jgi:hypothetical protein
VRLLCILISHPFRKNFEINLKRKDGFSSIVFFLSNFLTTWLHHKIGKKRKRKRKNHGPFPFTKNFEIDLKKEGQV